MQCVYPSFLNFGFGEIGRCEEMLMSRCRYGNGRLIIDLGGKWYILGGGMSRGFVDLMNVDIDFPVWSGMFV